MAKSTTRSAEPPKEGAFAARKAELEVRLLEEQLSPEYRRRQKLTAIAGASGLIIACVTVIGGLASVAGWFIQQNRDREVRIEERMARALSLLSEERPTQRAAAVSSLQSFLMSSDENRNAQVLVSIANALPLETSEPVRNAMLSFFEDVDPAVAGQQSLNLGLKSFAHNSRGLVRESDFWRKRPANLYRIESELKEGRALQAVARGMAILLRKGARWNDLSGVYLGRSDLTALDLAGINLDNSILAWSDFTGATLARASFDGADLEQTRFVGADLRSAKLTAHTKNSRDEPRFSYVQRQMERSREQAPPEDRSRFQVHISLPDFSCADLRDADFSGHALFGFARNGLHEAAKFYGSWPDFEGANLAGADMKHISVFVLSENDDRGWQRIIPTIGGGASGDGRYFAGIYQMNPEAGWGAEPSDYTKSLVDLQAAFLASNWGSAKLPRAIADWLAAKQVSQDASGRSIIAGTEPCKPRSPW